MFLDLLRRAVVGVQGIDGHDDSRRAESTLGTMHLDHRLLDGVEVVPLDATDPLDRCYVTPVCSQGRHQTRVDRDMFEFT